MFVDINFFDESYYLQPEFYQSFSTIGLSAWKSPAHTHYGAVGFGSFPQTSSSIITSSSPRSFTFLVYSGFGIRSLQRMALVARFENPDDAKLVSFDLDDLSESGFLLGPTFPKFSPDWVHRAELTILSTPPSFSRPIVILVSTVRAAASFDDARVSTLPYFDSTDFVGEKVVYRLVLSPPSS